MSNFKLNNKFDDFYKHNVDFQRGNKNGIIIKKSVEKYENGEESVLYIAELFYKGKSLNIGIGDTEKEIEQEINEFLETKDNFYHLEKINDYS